MSTLWRLCAIASSRLCIRRGLRNTARPWLVVIVTLLAVSGAAFSSSATDVEELSGAALEQWLRLAYVETEDQAGFGDLPIEVPWTPTLYSTSAAVLIRTALDAPIRDGHAIASWIGSLRTPDGLYDDPSEGAPILIETYWALSALRALDAIPDDSVLTHESLVRLIDRDGLAPPVGEGEPTLLARLLGAWQVIRCLHELGTLGSDPMRQRLQPTLDQCLLQLEESAGQARNCRPWSQEEGCTLSSTALRFICAIEPSLLPEAGEELLQYQLNAIADAPTDFIGSIYITELLEAAERYYGWSTIPGGVSSAIRVYLHNRVAPSLEPFGAFGWGNTWGIWLDPQMNIAYASLFHRIEEIHPYSARLLGALDAARIEAGWVRMAIAVPHPDYTYFGLTLCRAIEANFHDEKKLVRNATSILEGSESTLQDLLYAVRILKDLCRFGLAEREMLSSRIGLLWESQLVEDAYWLVRLVLESGIEPTGDIRAVLETRARQGAEPRLEDRPMLWLRESAWLLTILATDCFDPQEIVETVISLQSPEGGFLSRSQAPYPDLFSTLCAVETLAELGELNRISASHCLKWVERCYDSPGYLPASPLDVSDDEQGYADLYTTYMAVRIKEILE